MKLDRPFIRLPIRFDAERLATDIAAVPASAWRAHPQGYEGNSALPLIAAHGDPANDATKGPMRPTPVLASLPYVRQVMAALESPVGRSRLMRIRGNGEAHAHVDTNYYWQERHRVHVPIVTQPEVRFEVGNRAVNMAAGECWVFDTWSRHNVLNPLPTERIHLVIDTVGSPRLQQWIDAGICPDEFHPEPDPSAMLVAPNADSAMPRLETENQPVVMTPHEVRHWLRRCLDELAVAESRVPLTQWFREFDRAWTARFAEFGARPSGHPVFAQLLAQFDTKLAQVPTPWVLANGTSIAEFLRQTIVRVALNPELGAGVLHSGAKAPMPPAQISVAPVPPVSARPVAMTPASGKPHFDRPVFIVCPPRSGSSMLFETLCRSPDVFSIGGESHAIMEQIPALNPARINFDSNRADASLATPMTIAELSHGFFSQLRDRDNRPVRTDARGVRFLEKTPKNALRVAFLANAYPDAHFVVLHRHPRDTISSMLDAWRSKRFVTYPKLPGWTGSPWSLVLTPGWREWQDRPLNEIVARQWAQTVRHLLDDLDGLAPSRIHAIDYAALLADPQTTIERLCAALDLAWDVPLATLPSSRHTLTPPDPEKWRRNEIELRECLPIAEPMIRRFATWFDDTSARLPKDVRPRTTALVEFADTRIKAAPVPAAPATNSDPMSGAPAPVTDVAAFGSVYTRGMADALAACPGALAVTTYQSGRLVLLRSDGQGINTHFKGFPSPMGIAASGDRLAVATARGVWEYHNQRGIAASLGPGTSIDGCFVPRRQHLTGDIRVHEIAWVGDELWVANTRFSCLASLDGQHSFTPRWQPSFISTLEPTDRCHLNGLTVVDGRVRYVSCLAATDTAGGWRDHKADGGLIIDVVSGDTVAMGLSMPHSPRWYQNRLWVLESGRGTLSQIDPATGRAMPFAELPGFVRGLAFHGPYAFIGLSQVREGVFGGLPIMERLKERVSGIWVVDLRTANIAGFLRFEGKVQEIFDVALLPGNKYPELFEPEDDRVLGAFVVPTATMN